MSSLLPAEILELIFGSLENDNDLNACALVSSTFLPIARSLLFRHVLLLPRARQLAAPRSYSLAPARPSPLPCTRSESLSPYLLSQCATPNAHEDTQSPHEGNACLKLLNLLSISPTLAHHIKRLSIIDGRLFPCNDISASQTSQTDPLLSALGLYDPLSQQSYIIRDKLNGPQWFLETPPNALYTLFLKLREAGLPNFDLVFLDGPKISWNAIPLAIRGALRFLITSTCLKRVEIRGTFWDSRTDLRDLTDAMSNSGIKFLALQGVRILNSHRFGARIPNRGRSTTRKALSLKITDTCDSSRHAESFLPCGSNLKTQPSIAATTFPSINLPSHAYKRMLDLDSLSISSVPGPVGPQAPETLALLHALFLTPDSDPATPLVNPLGLKSLEIPCVELEHLPDVLHLLRQSGAAHGVESLMLGNRLAHSNQDTVTDLSDLKSLGRLCLGIYIPHNTSHRTGFLPSYYSFVPHPNSPAIERPSTLSWLNRMLTMLPPSLRHLVLNISIDSRSFRLSKNGEGSITIDHEDEWCILAQCLCSIKRGGARVDVNLDVDVDRGGFERGRGRGRTGWGLGWNTATMVGGMDVRDVRKWFDGLSAGGL